MALLIEPALLRGRDRYERVTTGRVDNTHDDAFTHTVRVEEPERALEIEVVATPSPDYAVRAVHGRALRGDVAPSVAEGVRRVAGSCGSSVVTGGWHSSTPCTTTCTASSSAWRSTPPAARS